MVAGLRAERFAWPAHVVLFLLGNVGLFALWALEAGFPLGWDPDPYWPLWVHATWGAGLAMHGLSRASLRRAGGSQHG